MNSVFTSFYELDTFPNVIADIRSGLQEDKNTAIQATGKSREHVLPLALGTMSDLLQAVRMISQRPE
jgi:hypothetical protein